MCADLIQKYKTMVRTRCAYACELSKVLFHGFNQPLGVLK